MVLGYMYKPDGTLLPVQGCDFKLQHHGENGKPPVDYSFIFQAGKFLRCVQQEHTLFT